MIAIQEITQWPDSADYNHIYLVNGDKVLAYIPHGTGPARYFSGPRRFDRRGRKFVELKSNPFSIEDKKSKLIEVTGSKGKICKVDPDAGTCTCEGFKWRGSCKHLPAI
jgi:hypothetical protein